MSALVLIADGDSQRAGRIAEACAARGFATRRMANGAEALDAALAHVPDALVAAGELELIPTGRLAEILRANPRTQSTALLFLGLPAGIPEGESWSAETLPPDVTPNQVVERVEERLERHARLDAVERQAQAQQEVHGQLTQIPLPDLLQLFHMNRRTGTISLRRRTHDGREERGRIHLRDGEVVQAVTGRVEGEKALLRLLAWPEGTFAFRAEAVPLASRIRTPTRALLVDAMRQLDEWRELGAGLPPLDAEVALRVRSGELPDVVHPVTQEVLLLLEIYTRVRDVVDRCSFPDYQALRTLQTLVERGLVELRGSPSGPSVDSGLLSRAQVRRLREWFAPARAAAASPLRDVKLVVASCDDAATRDFLALLAETPGVDLETPARDGRVDAGWLGRVGRLRVDAQLGIELFHAPGASRFAPLWPLLGHGALGTLLLLPEATPAAVRALGPLAEAMRVLPRVRLLPLLLGRSGETALPDEARESLALFEDEPILFLPSQPEREPGAQLRSLFARVIP